jgi:hypothetical protein
VRSAFFVWRKGYVDSDFAFDGCSGSLRDECVVSLVAAGAAVSSGAHLWRSVLLGAFDSLADDHEITMAFSYQFGANPQIDYPRLLISDTQETNHIFEDSEILMAYNIQASFFQSSMFYSPPAGQTVPLSPVSYLRIAALLLDSLAANKSRLSSITQLLDVHLSPNVAAKSLRDQAQAYRDTDDNSGAFVIIEQCSTTWSFQDRYFNQVQRQIGGGF